MPAGGWPGTKNGPEGAPRHSEKVKNVWNLYVFWTGGVLEQRSREEAKGEQKRSKNGAGASPRRPKLGPRMQAKAVSVSGVFLVVPGVRSGSLRGSVLGRFGIFWGSDFEVVFVIDFVRITGGGPTTR